MIEFNQIIFGLSAGEAEASRYPQLIRDGFFDKDNMINELVNGHKHLVLDCVVNSLKSRRQYI